jgi:Fe-S cluster biogenesis protein NfuA
MSTSSTISDGAADLRERIEHGLDTIRPALQSDGGDVEFVEFDTETGVVHLRLVGVCGSCPISHTTVKYGIERRLRDLIPEVREVQAR